MEEISWSWSFGKQNINSGQKSRSKKQFRTQTTENFPPQKQKTFFPKNFPVLAINYFDKISSIASRK